MEQQAIYYRQIEAIISYLDAASVESSAHGPALIQQSSLRCSKCAASPCQHLATMQLTALTVTRMSAAISARCNACSRLLAVAFRVNYCIVISGQASAFKRADSRGNVMVAVRIQTMCSELQCSMHGSRVSDRRQHLHCAVQQRGLTTIPVQRQSETI